jgi:hypothetical protein
MKKASPLDRADSLFANTYKLGCDFEDEKWVKGKANPKVKLKLSMLFKKKKEKKVIDTLRWLHFRPRVIEIRKAAASLTGWSKRTRYKDVADNVKAVWESCQKILDVMKSLTGQKIVYDKTNKPERLLPDSVRTAAYLSFSTGLCTLGRDGFLTVKDAKKDEEKRASDPKRWETEIQPVKPIKGLKIPEKAKLGRKPKYDLEADQSFADDWAKSKGIGVSFKDFCFCGDIRPKVSLKKGYRILDRVAYRNRLPK